MVSKKIFTVFGFFVAFLFIISKAQAVPFQLGLMFEPGFEYNKVDLEDLEKKDPNLNRYIEDKSFMGFNVPVMIQAIFLDGPIKPYLGPGYSYSKVWYKEKVPTPDSKGAEVMDLSLSLRNHNISFETGVNYMINPHNSLEALVGYSFSFYPSVGGSFNMPENESVDIPNVDATIDVIDYFRQVYAGLELVSTILLWMDLI